jgi:pyruvate kinase
MLSEESAMGQYPVDAVKVLDRVCRYTEPKIDYLTFLEEPLSELLPDTEGALSRAANTLALDLKPAAIVANTASGGTARLIARYRPPTPIVGMTAVERTLNQLTLSWGVFPETICKCETVDEVFDQVSRWARETGVAGDRDKLIVTAGIPLSVEGTTNLVKVIDMAIDGDY